MELDIRKLRSVFAIWNSEYMCNVMFRDAGLLDDELGFIQLSHYWTFCSPSSSRLLHRTVLLDAFQVQKNVYARLY